MCQCGCLNVVCAWEAHWWLLPLLLCPQPAQMKAGLAVKREKLRLGSQLQRPQETDYAAYAQLRKDVGKVHDFLTAVVNRCRTSDGRLFATFSLLVESTVPVLSAPIQGQAKVFPIKTEYIVAHVTHGHEPKATDADNIGTTLDLVTKSIEGLTQGGKGGTVCALPLPDRRLITMADGSCKMPEELRAPPPSKHRPP